MYMYMTLYIVQYVYKCILVQFIRVHVQVVHNSSFPPFFKAVSSFTISLSFPYASVLYTYFPCTCTCIHLYETLKVTERQQHYSQASHFHLQCVQVQNQCTMFIMLKHSERKTKAKHNTRPETTFATVN